MIDETALPVAEERLEQSLAASERIRRAGYVQVGLNHSALPTDKLAVAAAAGSLRRNFQGYTTDDAPVLLGFGASSIGSLAGGYVQNIVATGEYGGYHHLRASRLRCRRQGRAARPDRNRSRRHASRAAIRPVGCGRV